MRHTYLIKKTNARGFALKANLSLVSSGGTILHRHIMLTSLLPLLSNSFMLWNLQTKLILVITYEVPTLNTAILSIMMSLRIRSIRAVPVASFLLRFTKRVRQAVENSVE